MMRLSAPLRAQLAAWAQAGYPQESCGLLIGEHHGEEKIVHRVTQARNLNTARITDRYELDPQDYLAAEEAARSQQMDVIGVWHTHPDHPAQPSETDRAAAWPEFSYVILEVRSDGVRTLRSWQLNERQIFDEEAIES